MAGIQRDVRGVPLWLMREYLEDAGGEAETPTRVVGAGWTATLTQIEDHQVGSLRVGQVRLELEGTEEALTGLEDVLERMLLRGGG